MSGTVNVFDFLDKHPAQVPLGMAVIFGAERFLKCLALQHLFGSVAAVDDPEFSATVLDADKAEWADVHDELATRSLFGGDHPRIVVIDHADKFVQKNRERLEDYLNPPIPKVKTKAAGKKIKSKGDEQPAVPTPVSAPVSAETSKLKSSRPRFLGLLVLVVDTWPSITRLYKELDQNGLQINCDPPKRGKGKDEKRIAQWLIDRARNEYQFDLSAAGAQLVHDLTNGEFGRMDQELQKLALYVSPDGNLSLETIKLAVGGWLTQTTWEAIDAAAEGDAGKAIQLLDRLLRGGENPLALFAQIAVALRRYSTATEMVYRQLREGRRADLPAAIKSAGFPWWGNELAANERRLKRIGSKRAAQISQWLLEADRALKGSHSKEDRSRQVLENLLIRIALPA